MVVLGGSKQRRCYAVWCAGTAWVFGCLHSLSIARVLGTALLLGACASHAPVLKSAEVIWEDSDRHPYYPPPKAFYSSYTWDGADNALFRPLAEFWDFQRVDPSVNVNVYDEVPDSSWYTNRLSVSAWSPERVAKGACEDENVPSALAGKLTIVGGKPDGASPGFQIQDEAGRKYLMKATGLLQRDRPAAADVIGALVFHAAGYFVPCNLVINLRREQLTLEPGAMAEYSDGRQHPLTLRIVKEVLNNAPTNRQGMHRVIVSQFVPGKPISPWRYQGIRQDDPNDVIAHERRRELRGMYVLAAWLGRIDSRQENTLAVWIQRGGTDHRGYLRHYVIDFGEALGLLHPRWDRLNRRMNHSGYFDLPHMSEDYISMGLIARPWDGSKARFGKAGVELGYFGAERFVPDRWHPGYPNKAFEQMQEADAAWMARIIARFRAEHIRKMIQQAKISDPVVAEQLQQILQQRRDKILERWLTRMSPLAWPQWKQNRICMQDLAVFANMRSRQRRRYTVVYPGSSKPLRRLLGSRVSNSEGWFCFALVNAELPQIVDIIASSDGFEKTFPLRLHLVRGDSERTRIAAVERPERFDH